MIQLLIITLCFTFLGYRVSRRYNKDLDIVAHLSIGWLIGVGTFLTIMYFMGVSNIKWDQTSLRLIAAALFLISLTIKPKNLSVTLTNIDKTAYLLFALLTSFSLYLNTFWPIRDWDSLTLYDFRAQVFADTGTISGIFTPELNYYLAYPFFTTLAHTLSYIFNFSHPALFYSLIYFSLLSISYFAIKKHSHRLLALIVTLSLSLTRDIFNHSFIAYTNLPYTTYFILSIVLLSEAIQSNKSEKALLVGLLVGFSSHFRYDDPFWLIPVIISLYWSIKSRMPAWFINVFSPALFFRASWKIYKNNLLSTAESDTINSLINHGLPSFDTLYSRMFDVLEFLYKSLWIKYGFLIVLSFLSYFLVRRKINKQLSLLFASVVLSLIILVTGTYAMSFLYSKWYLVAGSVQRMFMIFYPLGLIASGSALGTYIKNMRITKDEK